MAAELWPVGEHRASAANPRVLVAEGACVARAPTDVRANHAVVKGAKAMLRDAAANSLSAALAQVLNARKQVWENSEGLLTFHSSGDAPTYLALLLAEGTYHDDEVRIQQRLRLEVFRSAARAAVFVLQEVAHTALGLDPAAPFRLDRDGLWMKNVYREYKAYHCPVNDPLGQTPLRVGGLRVALTEQVHPLVLQWLDEVHGLFCTHAEGVTVGRELEGTRELCAVLRPLLNHGGADGRIDPTMDSDESECMRRLRVHMATLITDAAAPGMQAEPHHRALLQLIEGVGRAIVRTEESTARAEVQRDLADLGALARLTRATSVADVVQFLSYDADVEALARAVTAPPPELQQQMAQYTRVSLGLQCLSQALTIPHVGLRAQLIHQWIVEKGRVAQVIAMSAQAQLRKWEPMACAFVKSIGCAGSAPMGAVLVPMPPIPHAPSLGERPLSLIVALLSNAACASARVRLGLRPAAAALLRTLSAVQELCGLDRLPVGVLRAGVVADAAQRCLIESAYVRDLAHRRIYTDGLHVGETLDSARAEMVDDVMEGEFADDIALASHHLRNCSAADLFRSLSIKDPRDDDEARQRLRQLRRLGARTVPRLAALCGNGTSNGGGVPARLAPVVMAEALCTVLPAVLNFRMRCGVRATARLAAFGSAMLTVGATRQWVVRKRAEAADADAGATDTLDISEAEVQALPGDVRGWLLAHAYSPEQARTARRAYQPVAIEWKERCRDRRQADWVAAGAVRSGRVLRIADHRLLLGLVASPEVDPTDGEEEDEMRDASSGSGSGTEASDSE